MIDFLTATGISFLVNTLFFFIAVRKKSDIVTDLSYGLSFFLTSLALIVLHGMKSAVALIPFILVMLWSLRIAGFLFRRILTFKVDHRFDGRREDPVKFAKFWGLQAISTSIIMLPVIATISNSPPSLSWLQMLGIIISLAGIVLEAIADNQKFRFKKDGKTGFISTGLWSWSRHPNYFGEMLVWWGLYLYVLPMLTGWWHLALAGPVYITSLLLFVSGIPLLEKAADQKFGKDAEYLAYKARTSVLIPRPPRLPGKTSSKSTLGIPAVPSLSMDKFKGRWYELARIPLPIARDWVQTSDVYEEGKNGFWNVRYEGKAGSFSGPAKVLKQKLRIPDPAKPGEMEVSFIPGVWMKYRLIHISDDGNAMLVTSTKMKYLWIMSRLPKVSEETYTSLVAKASEFGFDVSLLEKVPQ